ncbi:pleckstrin homology domain-containing family A member 8 [Elysia marginata]|uniref:Pleckstrin homology domain-containing family A member 8 n=1 Tax=Elysia marginata TaxID=1093978 RepID=A0AAV4GJP3_9GAST|nr:pleckstrin homology domain-containing family A member 8 [Elysia marginata]
MVLRNKKKETKKEGEGRRALKKKSRQDEKDEVRKIYVVSVVSSSTCRRMTTIMEGVLLKWTNYLSGWQPRWFILDNGVLSYYKSQEDVNNGCKGSIKMAVCDIVVHPHDNTRLDLIIPGEQHYYVKGSSAQDRQSWLIALGSSKASFSESSAAKKEADAMPDQMRSKKSELRLYCDLLMQQVHSIKQTLSSTSEDGKVDLDKLNESSSLIGATCDTFIATLDDCMRMVSNTPMFEAAHQHVRDSAIPASPTKPNTHRLPGTRSTITRPEKSSKHRQSTSSLDSVKIHRAGSHQSLNEATSRMVTPTSPLSPAPPQTNSLDPGGRQDKPSYASVLASNAPSSQDAKTSSSVKSDQQTALSKAVSEGLTLSASSSSPSSSVDAPQTSLSSNNTDPPKSILINGNEKHSQESAPPKGTSSVAAGGDGDKSPPTSSSQQTPSVLSAAASSDDLENMDDYKDAIDEPVVTFFSVMPTSFQHVDTTSEEGILAETFLDACRNIVPMFDKLNSTAFAPVKMDFTGNIKKVEQKQESNPELLTLQAMILSEVEAGTHRLSSSATSAVLWLKRSLEFIREFLRECNSGSEEMSVCASNAYGRTLKNYHGWVVRGVFTVAVKALPYRETFMAHMAVGENVDTTSRHFEHTLMSDVEMFVQHLDRVLVSIHDFYLKNSLDRSETV